MDASMKTNILSAQLHYMENMTLHGVNMTFAGGLEMKEAESQEGCSIVHLESLQIGMTLQMLLHSAEYLVSPQYEESEVQQRT
jgi:hypothetical protein